MATSPITVSDRCPSADQLREFSLGLLPDEAINRITVHVEQCGCCTTLLEGLDARPDGFLRSLRSSFARPAADAESGAAKQLSGLLALAGSGRTATSAFAANDASSFPDGPEAGGSIGAYRLLEQLGRGGMGRVFKARHESTGQIVAIKLMDRAQSVDDRSRRRFQRETLLSRGINLPNVVQSIDCGEDEGRLYFVMEHFDGTDLSQLVRSHGPLPIPDACETIRQAAAAIGGCHAHGIVHRDIKPSNLLLARDGVIKVLDLGLARSFAEDDSGVTQSGQFLGTADYIAPEQGLDVRDAGPRSDLYSLGCTLYFLLAARPPFGEHRTFARKLLAHVNATILPVGTIRDDVPAELSAILDRLLAKDPEQRPADCAELSGLLEPFAHGCNLAALATRRDIAATIPASTPGPARRRSAPGRRRRGWLISTAVAISALIGVVIWPLLKSAARGTSTPETNGGSESPNRSATTSAFPFQIDPREHKWVKRTPPVRVVHADRGFAFLTSVGGTFRGGAHRVGVVKEADGFWYLQGFAGRRWNTALAGSALWKAGDRIVQVRRWEQNAAAVKLIHRDKGICFLGGIGGGFKGDGEEIKLSIDPRDGCWYLDGRTLNRATWAAVIVVETGWSAGTTPEIREHRWTNGDKPVRMIHKDEGMCLLSGIGGSFRGAAEQIRVFVGKDGFWYLDGTSQQPRTIGWAMSVRLKTP